MQGRAVARGGIRPILTGSVGTSLRGEVALASWFREDSTELDAASIAFPIPAHVLATSLDLDLALPAATPARIVLLSSTDKYGERSLRQEPSLGWSVPAGFVGHLSLALDSARWRNPASPSDTTGFDTTTMLSDIQGIAIVVESLPGAPLATGRMEIDNIGWK